MKKLLALGALALSLASTTAFASTTHAVHIAGEVIDQTCQFEKAVSLVQLPKIHLSDLKANINRPADFSIKIQGCDTKSTQSVNIAFDTNGKNVTANGHLANNITSGNEAKGVQLKIMQEDGTPINLKDAAAAKSAKVVQRTAGGNAEFKFKAGYIIEPGATPTTGLVGSSIPVNIEYQ